MGYNRQRKLSSYVRPKAQREPRKTVLIICEGRSTEPNYLHALRIEKKLSSANIKIVPGNICGSHPKNVVSYAKEERLNDAQEGVYYDKVYCVFDRDEHTKIHEAFDMARANKIEIAFSNPNFEMWLLLHYQEQTAPITRQQVIKALKNHLPAYSKAAKNTYHIVLDRQPSAISRAHKLRLRHRSNFENDLKNPSTSVDLLIKLLNEI